MEIIDEDDEEVKRLMLRISRKEITLCDSCDAFFDYIPQKTTCDECKKKKYREYYQCPEVKERMREYMREYNQRPEVKAKNREYEQRPEVKERRREYVRRPEVKKRRREYNQCPEIKAKRRERNLRKKKLREEE